MISKCSDDDVLESTAKDYFAQKCLGNNFSHNLPLPAREGNP